MATQTTPVLEPADVAFMLAANRAERPLLYVAADESRAQAIAQAVAIASPDAQVLFCPGSDALPGEATPSSAANAGQRVAALHRIRVTPAAARSRLVLVTTGEACARLYPPPEVFRTAPPILKAGEPVQLEALAGLLSELGYVVDDMVDEPGEIAVRGQVVDIFPADSELPCRIEAEDGRIVAIRRYDPATQLTVEEINRLEVGRAAEPSLDTGVTLVEHLPHDARIVVEPKADEHRRRLLVLATDAANRSSKRAARDVVADDRWRNSVADRLALLANDTVEDLPRFVEHQRPLAALTKVVRSELEQGRRIVLLGHQRDLRFLGSRVAAALKRPVVEADGFAGITAAGPDAVVTMPIPAGRSFRRGDIVAIAAADLLGSRALRGNVAGTSRAEATFAAGEIAVGDVIVHEDHGIGVVDGLEPSPGGGGEMIALRYADDGRRLVAVADADRIWRYGADAGAVTLDRLDGASWLKRRGAIDAAIADSARALATLAEERAAQSAPVYAPEPAAYERFVAGFPYSDTPDQARAVQAVLGDLGSGRPMDRLIVGDVGYGKTEVALRAAAAVALAGGQVAIAAPTTVLARQHLESFAARFKDSKLRVAGLSRQSSAAEKRNVKAGLADGSIAIVVGTGAIAGKGIAYKSLGLVIVDEEQRFGSADKEKMRALGSGHLLTLSATPIPRTLQGALVGLRQLSIIATPPACRRPIRTSVETLDPERLRTALMREHLRGGQSFVVVPRIEDMEPFGERLVKLVPDLDVLRAHGKMPAADIDDAMVRFGRGEGDVLLATNIIEAGLDVPRANTMAVWRADRFGLSQLHQLRGRIGRGSRRGQILLLTEPDATIATRTLKRLRALEAFDRIGAGFAISARDLDMRGAGDLLGEAQAGHMKLIGIDLYQHLFASALRAARGEDVERWTPELNLEVEGSLSSDWIPEAELRVTLYARLARIGDVPTLERFEDELDDRFGTLPDAARTLIAVARIRLAAHEAGVARIDAGPAAIAFTLRQRRGRDLSHTGLEESKGRWILREKLADKDARLARVEDLLDPIGQEGSLPHD